MSPPAEQPGPQALELARTRAAEAQADDDAMVPLSPDQVEAAMRLVSNRIAKSVRVITDAEREFRDADREFDRAFAQAFLDYDGPQTEKRFAATTKTMPQRETRDIKHLAFQHVKRLAEALEDELRTLQSVNKSIIAMYGATRGLGS